MDLELIRLVNFKCFSDSGEVPIHKLTFFIGENDSGKTSILNALDIFLNNKPLSPELFHRLSEVFSDSCEIELRFKVNSDSTVVIPQYFLDDSYFSVKKVFKINDTDKIIGSCEVKRQIFEIDDLNNINSLKATALKELCHSFDLPYTKVEDAKIALQEYVSSNYDYLDKKLDWAEIKWNDISEYLPRVEYYGSSDYGNPLTFIHKTLDSVYRTFFYDYDEDGQESLKESLVSKKDEIKESLNKKIEDELKEKVQTIIPKVTSINGDFGIDFAAGFTLSDINVDYGQGPHSINNIGDGSKKRLYLAIIEWDKEVRSKSLQKKVIRCYDEPDASLDYKSQKAMFYLLKSLSENKDVNIQPIVSTHSLQMIDRASTKSINYIKHKDGLSKVEFLKGSDNSDISEFLDNVYEISGITNSGIFFERCFLIVEGETEYFALPILYKKYFDKCMSEDGVVLINLQSNSSWDKILKLFSNYKSKATLMLLDSDIKDSGLGKRLNEANLVKMGFQQDFFDNHIVLIGENEFEDVFDDALICKCLNEHWPKNGDECWVDADVASLRKTSKFSSSLEKMISEYKRNNDVEYDYLKKVDFSMKLANMMEKKDIEKIEALDSLFKKIESITE
ncbi:ATP-dependent nuclease [Methanolobus vulcani]|uniref:ATP-dependent nuclease n=1 Tax=Methanolobus vulcani TaxID=38026 RepID=UPI000B8868EA|nr:AAA family ATPase [Methanolobus vulcani]